jgi:hypothetical protein
MKQPVFGQNPEHNQKNDSSVDRASNVRHQMDLIDIGYRIIGKNPEMRFDSTWKKPVRLHISGSPTPAYSLTTGFAANVAGNIAFYLSHDLDGNISSILISPIYTQKMQIIVPIQTSIWTKGNKYYAYGDWRFLKYPEKTYGLGGYTSASDATALDYDYFRFYQFFLRKLKNNIYGGIGYEFEDHWNIKELNVPAGTHTDFDKYGFSPKSVSSGFALNILLDTRRNSINPEGGFYGNMVFRQNLVALASDHNSETLLIDLRKYFRVSHNSNNTLCFWSYNWLTLSGNPPYLDLPSNGWDTYSNTGRGYAQSRFRSKSMVDLEGEFRFGILNNGLLGGVVFGNAESYSEISKNRFEVIEPAIGAGIRIKFNKFSKTNICIDYAFGKGGSNGIFTNLGEVF